MEDVEYAANAMKYILSMVEPTWEMFDDKDADFLRIRDYWRQPALGGGFIADPKGLAYMDKDGILTPIFEEIDLETDVVKNKNAKNIFHIPEL